MTEESTPINGFQKDDRVKRREGASSHGTVLEVHEELNSSNGATGGEKALLVTVLWDVGTRSYHSPAALERI